MLQPYLYLSDLLNFVKFDLIAVLYDIVIKK